MLKKNKACVKTEADMIRGRIIATKKTIETSIRRGRTAIGDVDRFSQCTTVRANRTNTYSPSYGVRRIASHVREILREDLNLL